MISIRISGKNESQIVDIAKTLLIEKLVIDVNLNRGVERLELNENSVVTSTVCLLTAKTKGLLFPKIDTLIREKYSESLPEIYSLPIIHMDWDQAKSLKAEVIQV